MAYDGGEAPGEEGDFFENALVDGAAGQAGDVLEACVCPVVDYEEGEESGTDGIQPPQIKLVAY